MATETSIRIDLSGVEAVEREMNRLQGRELDRAIIMALNKTGAKAQTQADRAIRDRFAISRDQVRRSFVFVRARQGSMRNAEAVLRIFGSPTKRGRSMNMVRFLERQVSLAEGRRRAKQGTRNALHFKILRRGGLKTIGGAFLGNKGRTVFRRTGMTRLPIEPVQVIGVSQMFNTRSVRERVITTLEREYLTEMRRAIDQVLRTR